MIKFFNYFTKITGWPAYFFCFRTKFHFEDKRAQGRKLKKGTIIISNHTSVYDYALLLFTFPFNTIRCQMAEVLFEKRGLGRFLRMLGGIYVDRVNPSIEPLIRSEEILRKGGIVGIFPEGRIPLENEEKPLEFKKGAAKLAIMSNAKIIPVYTDGSYFNLRKRANIIIGKEIDPSAMYDEMLSESENIELITNELRKKIKELGEMLDERKKK